MRNYSSPCNYHLHHCHRYQAQMIEVFLTVNCKVGDWSPWGTCSASCNGGTKTRLRGVLQQAENGGVACPHLKEDEPCSAIPCKRGSHDYKKKEEGKFDNLKLKEDLIGTWLLLRRSNTISDRDGPDRPWLPLLAGLLPMLLLQADEGDGDSGLGEKSREQRLDSFLQVTLCYSQDIEI